ncbi:preprotein translocase subunit SecA [Chryseobacterium aquaticum]|uniref:Preprotein translocase subunit SecA n=1 Tax=Chryseobacterium aquaticum TaxID=452084 RepID=A0A0Q3SIG4_9FLAO|nr:YchJ family protein [Chryseobacterium aquaticum]KQK24978.1 preprotein translocase subunit SecA [Chryseobacterium aquaticum]
MTCPCCSEKPYEECCKPYHSREKYAPTAEALMRSRFSAFAIPNGEYLMETTFPAKRKFHNTKDLQEWGEINTWRKLEIVDKPSISKVEFKAFYNDEEGEEHVHHELSKFKMIQNRWYYVSGEFLD